MYFHFINIKRTAAGLPQFSSANPPAEGERIRFSIIRAATEFIVTGIWRCKSFRSFFCPFVLLWPILLFSPIFSQEVTSSIEKPALASNPEDSWTQSIVNQALENNPQYLAALHGTNQAKHSYESETAFIENPMLSFGLNNVPLTTFPSLEADAMTSMSFGLEQQIALPGESESRKKMAFEEFMSREKDAQALKLALIAKVEEACYNLVFLLQKKKLLAENRSALQGIVAITRSMVAVNKMNSAQLIKIEAQLSQLTSEISETSARMVKAESELENLTTQRPEPKLFVLDLPDPSAYNLPTGFQIEDHPLYKSAAAMLERARANKDHEISKYFPSLKFGAEYMARQPVSGVSMSGEDMISLRVTAPLPLFFPIKESRSVLAAEEDVKKAIKILEETSLRLKTSWDGEFGMASKYLDIYSSYHREVVPRYLASYRTMLAALASSQVNLLDVLDSYRGYLEVSIKEAEVHRDLRKSMALLKYLKGEGSAPKPDPK